MVTTNIVFLAIFVLPLIFVVVKIIFLKKNRTNKILIGALLLAILYILARYQQLGFIINNFWLK